MDMFTRRATFTAAGMIRGGGGGGSLACNFPLVRTYKIWVFQSL